MRRACHGKIFSSLCGEHDQRMKKRKADAHNWIFSHAKLVGQSSKKDALCAACVTNIWKDGGSGFSANHMLTGLV